MTSAKKRKVILNVLLLSLFISILVCFVICSGLFSENREVLKNDSGLTMEAWIKKERGVVVDSSNPKIKRIYRFMVISDRNLKKESGDDALWITKIGLYFRLTDKEPLGF